MDALEVGDSDHVLGRLVLLMAGQGFDFLGGVHVSRYSG